MSATEETDVSGEIFYSTKVHSVSRPGINQAEVLQGYKDWRETYDKDMLGAGYIAPKKTAEYLAKYIPEGSRDKVRILDIACGTGLVSAELRKFGFTNIDGLDPSEEMLNKAREENLYANYLKEFLTPEPLNIPENSYDSVVGSGCLAEGHMPSESLNEIVRLLKPGGYMVMTTRVNLVEESEYYKDFEPLMKRLEDQGKWKRICRDTFPRYYKGKEGGRGTPWIDQEREALRQYLSKGCKVKTLMRPSEGTF